MKKLRFGTAGIPLSTPNRVKVKTAGGIKHVRKLGLDHMELEFVRSVNISEEYAPEVKKAAQESDVTLSCHGQYFINLCSLEEKKIHVSVNRILSAARRAFLCGAHTMTFHAGFYQKREKAPIYKQIKKKIQEIVDTLKQENVSIWVRPETTGKPTQFGDIDELTRLSQEVDQVMPCIDFAHLCARTNGAINSYDEFHKVMTMVESRLGKKALQDMHIHLSGIHYSEKGERHHLPLKESTFDYKAVLKVLKEFNAKGVVACESPIIEKDALLLQKEFAKL